MATFKRIADVLNELPEPTGPRSRDVQWKPAAENLEEVARLERRLLDLAGKPLVRDGRVLYKCQACRDMHFLRADVPINHPHFGKVRYCPCSQGYQIYGPEWVRPGSI